MKRCTGTSMEYMETASVAREREIMSFADVDYVDGG